MYFRLVKSYNYQFHHDYTPKIILPIHPKPNMNPSCYTRPFNHRENINNGNYYQLFSITHTIIRRDFTRTRIISHNSNEIIGTYTIVCVAWQLHLCHLAVQFKTQKLCSTHMHRLTDLQSRQAIFGNTPETWKQVNVWSCRGTIVTHHAMKNIMKWIHM